MDEWGVWMVFGGEVVLIGALMLLLPRFGRRGLLYGVYVGEEAGRSERARRLDRVWTLSISAATVAGLALIGVASALDAHPMWLAAAPGLVLGALLLTYLWAHGQARTFAAEAPAAVVAPLETDRDGPHRLPMVAVAVSVVTGLVAVAHAWAHYAELPERLPVHFDALGRPDGWSERSLMGVLGLPLMVLVVGTFVSVAAWMTAHAKHSMRQGMSAEALGAQRRFRRAVANVVACVGMLTSVMLAMLSKGQIDVARGASESAGPAALVLGPTIALFAVGSVLYLFVRYGQGGSRFEGDRPGPLADGLADNQAWKWGVFYVAPDDPSFMVEKRFGLGYTINFGNPKAVALFGGFALAVIAVVIAVLAST